MVYFRKMPEEINPVALFLHFRERRIIKYDGKIEPSDASKNAIKGDKVEDPHIAVFIARGIAILLSRVGHIATKMTASHTQPAKF